jgi:hypothetical protein
MLGGNRGESGKMCGASWPVADRRCGQEVSGGGGLQVRVEPGEAGSVRGGAWPVEWAWGEGCDHLSGSHELADGPAYFGRISVSGLSSMLALRRSHMAGVVSVQ